MAATAFLDFQKWEILLAGSVRRAQMHHYTKCHHNRSFHCRDIAIFQIFKTAVAAIFAFWNHKFLLPNGVQRVETHQQAKFCQNQSIGGEDIKSFQDGGHPLSWICLGIFVPYTVITWGSLSLCKIYLVMIDAVVFIIWTFQYLARLAGNGLFTPPILVFWGNLIP